MTVSAAATGGNGGFGQTGATGGAGAATTLNNVAGGVSAGGTVAMTQSATGGAGGYSVGGIAGVGGAATSSLTFDDTASATQSLILTGTANALGGNGGYGYFGPGGGTSGVGGAATALINLTGVATVNAKANATGGSSGGFAAGGTGALGGAATATSTATGDVVTSAATAIGGLGDTGTGGGVATATGNGSSGTVAATAQATVRAGSLITNEAAYANAVVNGTSTAKADALVGTTPPAFDSTSQSVAFVTGIPSPASVSAVLAANPNISAAFAATASPSYFAIGEMGGGYSSSGFGLQTSTSEITFNVDLTKVGTLDHFLLGLYNPVTTGAGFKTLDFDVFLNNVHVVDQTFTTVADANTYFTDHALDLGQLDGNHVLAVDIQLSEVLKTPGSGYYFNFLAGDPPPLGGSSSGGSGTSDLHQLVAAMATFGADTSSAMPLLGANDAHNSGAGDLQHLTAGHA